MPYELLDEEKKEKKRSFVFDLMRYLTLEGWELSWKLSRSYSSVPRANSEEEAVSKERFSLQLFTKFQQLLSSPKLDVTFHLKVLFPLLTSYLEHHAGYFMPTETHRGHSFATKEEKLKIMQ